MSNSDEPDELVWPLSPSQLVVDPEFSPFPDISPSLSPVSFSSSSWSHIIANDENKLQHLTNQEDQQSQQCQSEHFTNQQIRQPIQPQQSQSQQIQPQPLTYQHIQPQQIQSQQIQPQPLTYQQTQSPQQLSPSQFSPTTAPTTSNTTERFWQSPVCSRPCPTNGYCTCHQHSIIGSQTISIPQKEVDAKGKTIRSDISIPVKFNTQTGLFLAKRPFSNNNVVFLFVLSGSVSLNLLPRTLETIKKKQEKLHWGYQLTYLLVKILC
jgi:hypothetical protein